uniref:Peroxisomal membrane protein 4 n=1 Tax=Suricata suricatta TaxID=37032 RepID=A0A673VDJ0_SURSU
MAVPPQLRALLLAVNALLRKRRYHAALAMLKGFRNGAVYGAKIRAPHALVMTFLFRSGSLQEKLRAILQATYTHSRNLACFVFTYKGLCALQARVQGETYQAHSFLAAFIGGLLLFGEHNNINSQINMYLLSRVLFALCRLGVEKGYIPEPRTVTCGTISQTSSSTTRAFPQSNVPPTCLWGLLHPRSAPSVNPPSGSFMVRTVFNLS